MCMKARSYIDYIYECAFILSESQLTILLNVYALRKNLLTTSAFFQRTHG